MADDDLCTCGHQRVAHEHFRSGTDCAFRDTCGCDRYRKSASQSPGSAEPRTSDRGELPPAESG